MYVYATMITNPNGLDTVYIGSRTRDYDDDKDYFGSGSKIREHIQRFGTKHLTKIKLHDVTDIDTLSKLEKEAIVRHKEKYGDRCLNQKLMGNNGNHKDKRTKKYAFIHIGTKERFLGNWYEFYKTYDLNPGAVVNVIDGIQPTIGGWAIEDRYLKDPQRYTDRFNSLVDAKTKIHTFLHQSTGREFTGTQKQFYQTFKLNSGNVHQLVRGKYKQTAGWTLKP